MSGHRIRTQKKLGYFFKGGWLDEGNKGTDLSFLISHTLTIYFEENMMLFYFATRCGNLRLCLVAVVNFLCTDLMTVVTVKKR